MKSKIVEKFVFFLELLIVFIGYFFPALIILFLAFLWFKTISLEAIITAIVGQLIYWSLGYPRFD